MAKNYLYISRSGNTMVCQAAPPLKAGDVLIPRLAVVGSDLVFQANFATAKAEQRLFDADAVEEGTVEETQQMLDELFAE